MQIQIYGAFPRQVTCHGSVDHNSLYGLYFDLVYVPLIIYTVFLYMRKHKWKRGQMQSKCVPEGPALVCVTVFSLMKASVLNIDKSS